MPVWFVALLLASSLLFPIARGIWLWTELFRITSKEGKLTLRRGRLPPALFSELADIAAREKLDGVLIRAVLTGGEARLVVTGPNVERFVQPMRNVLGRFTLPQLRSGRLRAGKSQ